MRVAITGASGFIGSHLIPVLLSAGYSLTAAVEIGSKEDIPNVHIIPADVSNGYGIPAVLTGAELVVHLAARNHVLKGSAKDSMDEYRRVNVVGTRNVIKEASDCGAKGFIHISTVKAMGEEDDRILTEDVTCDPQTPYGISKLESEKVVREEAARSGIRAIILRLPMVYGPRNKGNLPRMIRWADRGLPFPLFRPDNLRSMIYVENVVAGILATIKNVPEGVSTYILKDREDYSTRVVYSAICRELGKPPRFLPLPAIAMKLGGMFSEDFRKVTGSLRVSSSKVEKEIGFFPPFSLEEGIARTVQWYKRSVQ